MPVDPEWVDVAAKTQPGRATAARRKPPAPRAARRSRTASGASSRPHAAAGASTRSTRPRSASGAATRPRSAAGAASRRRAASNATSRRAPAPSRRLGPRRLGPRQGGSRIQWDRLGRTCLVLVIAAICFSYFNPAINLVNSYKANSEAQRSLSQLTAENARLQARTKAMQDPVVLTREARRQGMALPGERAYVIRGLGG